MSRQPFKHHVAGIEIRLRAALFKDGFLNALGPQKQIAFIQLEVLNLVVPQDLSVFAADPRRRPVGQSFGLKSNVLRPRYGFFVFETAEHGLGKNA